MMMVRKSKGLGERHQKILNFLSDYQRENRYPPSIREIGEKTGISSTSVVNYYLDQLEKKGLIHRDRKISRGVRLSLPNGSADTLRVPILGPIAAGLPAAAADRFGVDATDLRAQIETYRHGNCKHDGLKDAAGGERK